VIKGNKPSEGNEKFGEILYLSNNVLCDILGID